MRLRGERRALGLAIALALLAVAAAAGAADREVVVFEPRNRPAEELLPLARIALGESGQAAVDPGSNSLVLAGPRGRIAEALELLRRQDRRLRTVVLQYESQRVDSLEARGIVLDWSVGSGSVRVGNVRLPDGAPGLRLSGFAVGTEREGGLAGTLRVAEGRTGRITTGRSVPVTRRSFRRHYDGVDVAWVTAESGFEARPRILADGSVRVELLPIEASVDRRGRVDFTHAATTVTLRPGETIALGGIDRRNETHSRGARVLSATQRSAEERVLLLSVQVEGHESEGGAAEPGS